MNNSFVPGDLPSFSYPALPNYHPTVLDKVILVGAVAGAIAFAKPDYNLLPVSNEEVDIEQVYAIADCLAQLNTTYRNWENLSIAKEQNKKDILIQNLLNQVFSFRSLDNNWDGYGAIPVSALAASATSQIIHHLSEGSLDKLEDIFPNTNGSISLKWTNLFGERISLSVGAHKMSYYVAKLQHEVVFSDDIEISSDSIELLDSEILSIVSVNA